MNNSKEVWKDIQDYEGYYQVSSMGRVRSKDRTITCRNGAIKFVSAKSVSLYEKENGYLVVHLYRDNKGKTKYIHRLVANAFIPNPNNLSTVNHKDGNKHNNTVANLEWASYSDNNQHAYDNGLKHSNRNNPHMSKKVVAYSIDGKKLYSFPSMREAERQLGLANGAVSQGIKHGWHYHNFIWKLENS